MVKDIREKHSQKEHCSLIIVKILVQHISAV